MLNERFIRAIEIWVPTADGLHIDLEAGAYGDLYYFAAVSRGKRFASGEALPGKVMKEGRPIVLKDLRNSYFQRGDAAASDGLTCAVAVPDCVDGKVRSVVVYFCSDDRFRVGAIEVWGKAKGHLDLSLEDGYFGRAEKFEFASRHTSFPRKMGLPGRVWDSGQPEVIPDLGRGAMFLRRDAAAKVGINRAVGIPLHRGDGEPGVLTFLSACNTPIAGRFEIWRQAGEGLFRFVDGYCESGIDLADLYRGQGAACAVPAFARACRRGIAEVVEHLPVEAPMPIGPARSAGLNSLVALPVQNGRGASGCDTVLAWYA